MHRAVRIGGYVLGGLGGLLIVAGIVFWIIARGKLNRTFDVAGHALTIPADSASLAEGERLASIYGCRDCHGGDLGGGTLIDAPVFLRLAAPNLTSGEGGIGGDYSALDYERAIRHGVARDGRSLMAMPSDTYQHFTDEDIARIIAYVRQAAPVDRTPAPKRFGPLGIVLAATASGEFLPAGAIDHGHPHPVSIAHDATLEFGRYYGRACMGCHAADLSGSETGPGGGPPPANITPDPETGIGTWTFEDFERAVRHGLRPDGTQIDPDAMPWVAFSRLTDEEIEGVWLFVQSVPAVRIDRRP